MFMSDTENCLRLMRMAIEYILISAVLVLLCAVVSPAFGQTLGTPSLNSPANGATNQPTTVTLSWTGVSLATSYGVQVSTNNAFSSLVADQQQGGTSYTVSGLSNGTTYYWRVRASTVLLVGGWSSTYSFTTASGVTPPAAPTLVSPSNGATDQPTSIVMSWNASAGASRYWLQVATDQSFTTIVVGDSTIASTSHQVNYLSASTTYYWRVMAINGAGVSAASSVWDFTTASSQISPPSTPSLLSPANGASGEPAELTLSWQTASNADHYYLQVATDETFSNIVFSDYTIVGTSENVDSLVKSTTYYWHVSAVNTGGQSSWSSTWTFATGAGITVPEAPLLVSPSNGAENEPDTLTFDWHVSSGAAYYRLQISSAGSFTNLFFDDSTLTDTLEPVSGFNPGATYYWRVSAKNSAGMSSWSSTWYFSARSPGSVPPAPVLLSPLDGATSLPLVDSLEWNTSQGARSYRVELSRSSAFDSQLLTDTVVSVTSLSTGPLVSGTTYYWRVNAENNLGSSGWSSVWKFTTSVTQPATPVLLTPANGTIDLPTTVVFTWNEVQGAVKYDLQVATASSFDSLAIDDSTIDADSYTGKPLRPGTTYFWRVRAMVADGTWTAFSDPWSFTTTATASSPGQVTAAVSVDYPTTSDTVSLKPSDYRLVGVPGASGIPISSMLSGTPGKDWTAYWDNGAPSNYLVKFNPGHEDTIFTFSLGRAFWLIHNGPLVFDTTVAASPLDSAGLTHLPLHKGWNLITDPFADSVSWTAVQKVNSTVEPLYAFRGAFQTSSVLTPGHGYYYFNSGGRSVLLIPYPEDSSSPAQSIASRVSAPADGWTVNVSLTSDGITDNAAWFGASPTVDGSFNRLDVHKPTGMDGSPSAYFSHPDWDSKYTVFASEIHPVFRGESEWKMDVKAAPLKKATIQFKGIDRVPAEFDVYAFDPASKSWLNLRESPSFSFIPEARTSSIRIIVGRQDLIKQSLTQKREISFKVGPNYPNPFNPSTTIPIYTPRGEEIEISVFNVIGQKIARVYDGYLSPGNHRFIWNGRDGAGHPVPSGVYFYRVISHSGVTVVRKMVLLK